MLKKNTKFGARSKSVVKNNTKVGTLSKSVSGGGHANNHTQIDERPTSVLDGRSANTKRGARLRFVSDDRNAKRRVVGAPRVRWADHVAVREDE